MESKKSKKANLENYTRIFRLLGIILSLFIIYQALEWTTYYKVSNLNDLNTTVELEEEIPITRQILEEIKQPPPPPPSPENIEVIEDTKEIIETVLKSTETNENEEVSVEVKNTQYIDAEDIGEVDEIEEINEEVPFSIIENVPVFPGCRGTNTELRECMSNKISVIVNKNFNIDLAQDLGLTQGIKRISVQFVIDKNGTIQNIKARAPHPRLQKEAIRIIKLLPVMIPGKQRNKAVRVRYNLPIVFDVR